MRSGYFGFCFAQDAGDLGEEGFAGRVGRRSGPSRAGVSTLFEKRVSRASGSMGLREVVDGVYTEGLERVLVRTRW